MSPGCFERAVVKIKRVYGGERFQEDRERIWWEAFRHATDEAFERLVDHMIVEHMSFPPLSKWHGALSAIPHHRAADPENFYPPCEACGTSGYVEAKAKDPKQGNCIFRCTCPAGEKIKIRNLQHFGPEHYAEFEMPKAERGHERAGPNLDLELARQWAAQYGKWKPGLCFQPLPYDKTQRITDEMPGATAETKAKLLEETPPELIF